MIIVFTGVHYGGMLQFTNQLVKTLNEVGHKAIAFIPDLVENDNNNTIVLYKNKKTFNLYSRSIKKIIDEIMNLQPSMVIFSENSLICCEVLLRLPNKIKTVLAIHDARLHPSNSSFFIRLVKSFSKYAYMYNSYKKVSKLLFMSESTKKDFLKAHSKFINKCILLPLGAHVPNVISKKPEELFFPSNYMLFFGRIDKYKGIGTLLRSYKKIQKNVELPLVIAGNGKFTENELSLLQSISSDKICVINRYIQDPEMVWLFMNASFLCLPYTEASQSGVIPIAYYFGKPVVVSDIKGLVQFVDEGKTGYIFKTSNELEQILINMSNDKCLQLKDSVKEYYNKYLDWEKNINSIVNNDNK